MAKKELGNKWTCDNCESRFFDLNRDPIICPSCKTLFHPLFLPERAALVIGQPKRTTIENPAAPPDVSDDVEDADNSDEEELPNDQVDPGFDNPGDLTR